MSFSFEMHLNDEEEAMLEYWRERMNEARQNVVPPMGPVSRDEWATIQCRASIRRGMEHKKHGQVVRVEMFFMDGAKFFEWMP